MGFTIKSNYPPLEKWYHLSVPAGTGCVGYVGQLVTFISHDGGGVYPLTISGTPDTTNVPFGIITATNNRTPVYNTTYMAEQITSMATVALVKGRTDYAFQEGMLSKGDSAPMVKVALLDHTSIVEGPLHMSTITGNPGVVTVTTGGTGLGASVVHSAADMTAVDDNNMYYWRTGANSGLYRMSSTSSATAFNFRVPLPNAVAVGDTACVINFGLGRQYMTFDSVGMWIEMANHTAEVLVDVVGMDLRTAGQEVAQFRFITV